jgi:hypothetical protein
MTIIDAYPCGATLVTYPLMEASMVLDTWARKHALFLPKQM